MLQLSNDSAWDFSMCLAGNDGNSDKSCRDTKNFRKRQQDDSTSHEYCSSFIIRRQLLGWTPDHIPESEQGT